MNVNAKSPLRRTLAMLLCVAMLMSIVVVPVGATETDEQNETISDTAETDETQPEAEADEAVASVIAMIVALPSSADVEAYMAAYEEMDDLDGLEGYLKDIQPEIKAAYEAYEALTEEQKAQVTNADKLLELEWVWSMETYDTTTSTGPSTVPNPDLSAAENTTVHLFNYGSQINEADHAVLRFTGDTGDNDKTQKVETETDEPYHRSSRDVATNSQNLQNGKPEMLSVLGEDGYPYVFDSVIDVANNDGIIVENKTNPGSLKYLFDKDSDFVTTGAEGSATSYDPTVNTQYVSKHFAVSNENGEGTGLFWKDEDGYLVFDSADHRAYFNPSTSKFELYDYALRPFYGTENLRGQGHFLPFNNVLTNAIQITGDETYTKTNTAGVEVERAKVIIEDDAAALEKAHLGSGYGSGDSKNFLTLMKDYALNNPTLAKVAKNVWVLPEVNKPNVNLAEAADYYYGMSVEFEFFMPKDGKIGDEAMIFDFLGDDDVWVYIDDVLVLNIGGAHNPNVGYIDFTTGGATQPLATSTNTGAKYQHTLTLRELYEAAEDLNGDKLYTEAEIEDMFDGNTFADYTKHTLKFFYMERGAGSANCRLRFNMPTLPKNSLTVGKELTVTGDGSAEDKIAVENSLSYQFRVWQSDAEGNVSNVLFIKTGTTYDILEGANKVGTGTVDKDGCFSLKAGQQAQFADMLTKGEGVTEYVVEEILPAELEGQYGSVQYQVGDKVSGTTKPESGQESAFSSFFSGSVSAEETQLVTFRNEVKVDNLGTLKVRKEAATGSAFDMDKEFQIQVKLGGVLLPVETEYKVGDETRKVNTPGILELRIGETAELDKMILSGTEYEITELIGENDQYQATYTGTVIPANTGYELTASGTGVTGKFPLGGTVEVTVTNENFDFSGLIPITKTTVGNTGAASFQFAVDQVTAGDDGSWTVTTSNVSSAAITVAGDTAATANAVIAYDNSTNDTTFYYKVYELDGNGPYDYDDTFYIVEVYVGYNKAEIKHIWKNGNTKEEVEAVSFVNQKLTSVIVTKNVLGIKTEEAFGFKATINGVATEFTLVDDGTYEIPNIPVGANVTVEETQAHGYFAHYRIGSGAYSAGNQAEFNASEAQTYVTFVNTSYVADDTVVIDYGLPVDIHVLANDALPDDVTISIDVKTGDYGNVTITNNVVRYTPTTMVMNDVDVFTYEVTYAPAQTGIEHVYGGTLTVIPATTIYYEDSFVAFEVWSKESGTWAKTNETWETEGTAPTTTITQAEDRPGEALSSIDANNVYGYDAAYSECSTYSMGSARYVTADANTYGTATFTFYGTGFDVVSLTSSNTGTITVNVYEGTATSGATAKKVAVDTYYGYTKDDDGNWVVDSTATNNALYQVPVITVEDLPYGQYTAVIKCAYNTALNHQGDSSYNFYLDAIRVYDPANNGAENNTIKGAYVADGEGWPEYTELRDLLISKETFGTLTTNSISGAVFIDGEASVDNDQIADYISYGPNNEVYLASRQAVSFDLSAAAQESEIASVQIGVKSVGGTGSVKIYDAKTGNLDKAPAMRVATATDMYYDITDLNGGNVVIYNSGEFGAAIISITNIKVTYTAEQPSQTEDSGNTEGTEPEATFSISRASVNQAVMSLSLGGEAPGESETREPEVKETEPEATEPEVKETEPKATEPEVKETEPKATEPEVKETEPKATEPEVEETEPETEPTGPEDEETSIVDTVMTVISSIIRGIGWLLGKWFG